MSELLVAAVDVAVQPAKRWSLLAGTAAAVVAADAVAWVA
jgi:hypothetical protein